MSDDEKVMRLAAALAQAYEFGGTVNKYDVQAAHHLLDSDVYQEILHEVWEDGVDAARTASQPFIRPINNPYRKARP